MERTVNEDKKASARVDLLVPRVNGPLNVETIVEEGTGGYDGGSVVMQVMKRMPFDPVASVARIQGRKV